MAVPVRQAGIGWTWFPFSSWRHRDAQSVTEPLAGTSLGFWEGHRSLRIFVELEVPLPSMVALLRCLCAAETSSDSELKRAVDFLFFQVLLLALLPAQPGLHVGSLGSFLADHSGMDIR